MWLIFLTLILLTRFSQRGSLVSGGGQWADHVPRGCSRLIGISRRWGWARQLPGGWPDGDPWSTNGKWTQRRAALAHAPIPDLTLWFCTWIMMVVRVDALSACVVHVPVKGASEFCCVMACWQCVEQWHCDFLRRCMRIKTLVEPTCILALAPTSYKCFNQWVVLYMEINGFVC